MLQRHDCPVKDVDIAQSVTPILHLCGLSYERTSLQNADGLLIYYCMVYVMVLLVTWTV